MEEKEKKTRTRRVKAKEESPKAAAAKEINAQAEQTEQKPKQEETSLKSAEPKAEAAKPESKPSANPKNTEAKAKPIAKDAPKAEPKPASSPANAEPKPQIEKAEIAKPESKPTQPIAEAKPPIAKFAKSSISDIEVAKKLINIYQSAQDRKLQFNLSFEYVKRMLEYKTCYYTGKAFTEDGPNARSFDRVDSDKGYIEGNVVACTIEINGKKSNLSFEEISCLYHKLAANKEKAAKKEAEKAISREEDFSFSLEEQK